jgi:hypothetical protein
MFTITTLHTSNASGRAQVRATGHGKQRTISLNHALSDEQNRAHAVGTLLDTMLTPEQRAKMQHPSAKGRVRVESLTDGGGKHRWTIDV